MLWGYAVLFATDAILVLLAVWLLRSRRYEGTPPLWLAILAAFGAFTLHILAYMTCQVLMLRTGEIDANDTGGRMFLLIANMVSGAAPVVLFAYTLVASFAHTVSSQLSMTEKKPEPVSSDSLRRARSLAAQGRYTAAIEDCRKLAARFPDSPLPWVEIALIQQRMECPAEAAETLRVVLRKFSQFEEVRRRASLLLADLLEYSLEDPEGAAHLRNFCRKENAAQESGAPVAQWVDMTRARNLAKQGDVDRAVAGYLELFRANPEAPRPMFEAATTLEKAERPEDAVGVLQELIRASTDGGETWAEAVYRLANLLENSLYDCEGSRHALREVLCKAPGSKAANLARETLRRDADRLTDM